MNKKLIALTLAGVFMLSGCGSKREVPELIEPKLNNESYRPVERGMIIGNYVEIADVIPEEYCVFTLEAVTVDEILVDIGEYVEEGTVVAKVNTEKISSALYEETSALGTANKYYEFEKKINDEKMKKLEYQIEDAEAYGNELLKSKLEIEKKILSEDIEFAEIMNKHQNRVASERISQLNKSINDIKLVAPHSGYVTYVKNLGKSPEVQAYENVVVVSDFDNLHLELESTVGSSLYKKMDTMYDERYILHQGKKVPLKLKEYTNEEYVAMESNQQYPQINFTLDSESEKLKLGDKVPVYFNSSSNKETIRIGKDSLYTEGSRNFVYVKNGESKEPRDITIGRQSNLYVEVLDGLEEGELVYYSSKAIMPDEYDTITIEPSTFEIRGNEIGLTTHKAYTKLYSYNWYNEAEVDKVFFDKGEEVKKGDLVCTLKTKDGAAARIEISNALQNAKESQDEMIEDYDKQLEEMDKVINEARKIRDNKSTNAPASVTQVATETDAATVADKTTEEPSEEDEPKQSATYVEQLLCDKHILEYQKEMSIISSDAQISSLSRAYQEACKNNDGNGIIKIYANQDGFIGQMTAYEGKTINEENNQLFKIFNSNSEKISFDTNGDVIGVGNDATLILEDGTEKVINIVGNAGTSKKFIARKNDRVYITNCEAENKAYLPLDGISIENYSDTKINYMSVRISDAIAIPPYMVFQESDNFNPDFKREYVWKLVDGNLVKQYVTIQDNLRSKEGVCILEGLKAGDLVAYVKVVEKD